MFTIKITDKNINFRIKPYFQEAFAQIIIDIAVMVIVTIVFAFADFPVIAYVAVVAAYLLLSLFLHYKVAVLAIADRHKNDYVTEIICIKKFNEEYSFAGDRMGRSNLRFFYPKEMSVSKYKLNVVSDDGTEKKLRTVMSLKRRLNFSVLNKHQIEYLKVTYLKKSKIIVDFDLSEDINKNTNKRKTEEIEKIIKYINSSI